MTIRSMKMIMSLSAEDSRQQEGIKITTEKSKTQIFCAITFQAQLCRQYIGAENGARVILPPNTKVKARARYDLAERTAARPARRF